MKIMLLSFECSNNGEQLSVEDVIVSLSGRDGFG